MNRDRSVAVVVRLVGTFHRHVDVIRLILAELGELGADATQVKSSHHLIEMLGQHVHLFGILIALGEQLDLSQHLIGERVTHHKAGVAGGTAQIHEAAFRQQDDFVAAGQRDVVHLRLDVLPCVLLEGGDIDLVVEVADVADDGFILHLHQVLVADHLIVASGGDEDVHICNHVLEADDAVTLHGRLQGADRINLGDADGGTEATQGLGRTLAHVAIADHQGLLAGHHHIGGPLDAVHQRLAATVEVVELALSDRVVDVDSGEGQFTALLHLVETRHARGGLLGHTLDLGLGARIKAGVLGQLFLIEANRKVSSSLPGLSRTVMSCSALLPSITRPVASPPSSRIMLGEPPSPHSRMRWV